MLWLRLLFLFTAFLATSGYKFRCYIFCTDQTGIQHDYTERRDHCREYAQLKLDMVSKSDDRNSKAQLVSLFSDCMGQNNWTVPDGRGETRSASGQPLTPPPQAAPASPVLAAPTVVTTSPPDNRAEVSRSAECAFARQAASVSRISAVRAEACDIECAERIKAAPGAPRPAACPSEHNPQLARGVDTR